MSISGSKIDSRRTYSAYRLCGTLLAALLLVLGAGAVEAAPPRSVRRQRAACPCTRQPARSTRPESNGNLHREPRRRQAVLLQQRQYRRRWQAPLLQAELYFKRDADRLLGQLDHHRERRLDDGRRRTGRASAIRLLWRDPDDPSLWKERSGLEPRRPEVRQGEPRRHLQERDAGTVRHSQDQVGRQRRDRVEGSARRRPRRVLSIRAAAR